MRECDFWKGALNAYYDYGWDGLWAFLNDIDRRFGLDDSEAWKIAYEVKKAGDAGVEI